LNTYNNYSNTDDLNTMSNDQLQKMLDNRKSPEIGIFLLSWTLTQNAGDIINFAFASILDLAAKANPALYNSLWINMNQEQYPNVLMVDAFPKNGDVTAMALAINYYFARTCATSQYSSFAQMILDTGGFS
jgi:hypothetical protein